MPKNTINNIYAVSSGKARITAEGFSEVLAVGDVAAMPCWHAHAIEAVEDTVLLRVSDEPLMSKVGLLRTAG
jgi:gentisate 1,2-dioxygenase